MLKLKKLAFGVVLGCASHVVFAGTTVSFYAKDQHGSIAGATDANGNLTATALNQYNDYGVNQSNSSSNSQGEISIMSDPYQYSGEYTDNESGLQPLGNGYRYYDPSLMRFISPDSYPLLNLYAYGSGNPIGNVDPTGHMSQGLSEGLGIGGAVAGDIGAGVGLCIAIATMDPIAMLGATLGLLSAGTGGASTALSMINHGGGSKSDTTAEEVLNVFSIGFAIGSAGLDAGSALGAMADEGKGATTYTSNSLSQENAITSEVSGGNDSETTLNENKSSLEDIQSQIEYEVYFMNSGSKSDRTCNDSYLRYLNAKKSKFKLLLEEDPGSVDSREKEVFDSELQRLTKLKKQNPDQALEDFMTSHRKIFPGDFPKGKEIPTLLSQRADPLQISAPRAWKTQIILPPSTPPIPIPIPRSRIT